jgi:hypothetical protein
VANFIPWGKPILIKTGLSYIHTKMAQTKVRTFLSSFFRETMKCCERGRFGLLRRKEEKKFGKFLPSFPPHLCHSFFLILLPYNQHLSILKPLQEKIKILKKFKDFKLIAFFA